MLCAMWCVTFGDIFGVVLFVYPPAPGRNPPGPSASGAPRVLSGSLLRNRSGVRLLRESRSLSGGRGSSHSDSHVHTCECGGRPQQQSVGVRANTSAITVSAAIAWCHGLGFCVSRRPRAAGLGSAIWPRRSRPTWAGPSPPRRREEGARARARRAGVRAARSGSCACAVGTAPTAPRSRPLAAPPAPAAPAGHRISIRKTQVGQRSRWTGAYGGPTRQCAKGRGVWLRACHWPMAESCSEASISSSGGSGLSVPLRHCNSSGVLGPALFTLQARAEGGIDHASVSCSCCRSCSC